MNIGLIGQEIPSPAGGLERRVQDCADGLARSGCRVRVISIVGEGRGLASDEILLRPGGSPIQVHRSSVPGADDPGPGLTAGACRGLAPHWCTLLADADVVCSFGATPALAGAEIRRRLELPFIAVLPDPPGPSDARFREVLGCGADLLVGLSRSDLCVPAGGGLGRRERVRRAFPLRAQTDRYLQLFSSITAARAAA